ncbi:hypothetical protein [Nocardioides yefusunii]|uniref:DUF732 domain-containing protein n=1 Tax=Nocardioides yefusunii TaxID=2500546 RepID=A0ABW1QZ26_9ACTN|nr:hypothetical protein [Nocardioides yefusunii]
MTHSGARGALLAVCAAALTVLTGCSSDGSPSGTETSSGSSPDVARELTADERPYADAIVAPMQAQSDTPVSDEDARCFADRVVPVVGLETLRAGGTPAEVGSLFTHYDLSTLDVSEQTARDAVAVLDACGIDLREAAVDAARSDVSSAAADCIDTSVDAAEYREILVTQFHRGVTAFEDVTSGDEAGLDAGQKAWAEFAGCVVENMAPDDE